MEPEWPASTAHAAGGALSLLALATTDAASGADSTAVGQMQIWQRVHLCAPPCLVLIEAPVCAACCCAGAALVPVGLQARRDAFGYQLCKDCGARLNRCKGKLHRSGAGHICHCCYTKAGRAHAAASVSKPTPHSKRPYDTLQSTQQWKRRTQLRSAIAAAEQEISCPRATVTPQPIPSPVELIHLPTSVREAIRTVPSLRIPSEQTMIKCKQQLATSHATGTGTFAGGTFMTDPVRFVSVLCAQSSFIAVGGDAGGSEACHHRALGGLQRGIGPARPQRAGDQQVDQERMQHDHAGSYWRIFRPPCSDDCLSLHPLALAASAAPLLAPLRRLAAGGYRRLAHCCERHPSALASRSTFEAISEAAHAAPLCRIR